MKTPISRRIFFWTLVVTYFCITATVLFFTFGYRFSSERGIFVYSGSLTIKANPVEVGTAIDGDTTSGRRSIINDSYHITGFRPGEHIVSVFADGFQQWSKKVQFTSGKSTEFWNILLVRDTYERTQFSPSTTQRFFLSPEQKLIASVFQNDTEMRVQILDRLDPLVAPRELLRSSDRFTQNNNLNIEWSPRAQRLLIPIERVRDNTEIVDSLVVDDGQEILAEDFSDYVIVSLEEGSATFDPFYLSTILTHTAPMTVRWDPKDRDTLYFIANNTLFQKEIGTDQRTELSQEIATDVATYDFADDGLYILKTDGSLLRASLDTPQAQKILTDLTFDNAMHAKDLIAYDRERLTVLTTTNTLALYDNTNDEESITVLSEDAIGSHFSDDGKKLLYWNDFEIFTYFIELWDTQPIRHPGEGHNITRLSQPIKNVQWAKTFEHVLFSTEDALKVIEIDHRGNRNQHTVTPLTNSRAHVVSDFPDDKIFFTDGDDKNGENSTHQIFSIDFREPEPLF